MQISIEFARQRYFGIVVSVPLTLLTPLIITDNSVIFIENLVQYSIAALTFLSRCIIQKSEQFTVHLEIAHDMTQGDIFH